MELASNRFIAPTVAKSPVLTLVEPAPEPARKLGPDDIARVFKQRLARLGRPNESQLGILVRDAGIATAVDVLGLGVNEVARLQELSRARVSTILTQIRAEAGAR